MVAHTLGLLADVADPLTPAVLKSESQGVLSGSVEEVRKGIHDAEEDDSVEAEGDPPRPVSFPRVVTQNYWDEQLADVVTHSNHPCNDNKQFL